MKCPRCGLFNPESAQRCDCGYDFETRSVDKAYFSQGLPKSIKTFLAIAIIGNIVSCLEIFTGGKVWEITIALIWSVVVYWLYWRLVKKDNWARIVLIILTFPLGLIVGLSTEAKLYCLQK